ncbi:hypothetical protein [uncultured Roseobacter sp.]|uniref:hypothetical protein n=1 Tax=uncultured Roseobacter sp. TaxID=114847 RepID=UPI00263228C7|nr:hypothetical protein [uncultured Roseobacter sp.]
MSKLYSVSEERNRTEPLDIDHLFITQYYKERCVDPGFISAPEEDEERDRTFVVICSQLNSIDDAGEVAIFRLRKYGTSLVKHYYRVRVPAAPVGSPPNLPKDEFEGALARLLSLGIKAAIP